MKKLRKSLSILLLALMALGLFTGCSMSDVADIVETAYDIAEIVEEVANTEVAEEALSPEVLPEAESKSPAEPETIDKNGIYSSAEDVALYIHTYGCLPSNFISKNEARDGGWPGGSLEPYFPGMCIGGDRFGNKEGLLPDAKGRKWTECDIDTLGADSRGAKRIVFSNDGLIYYTDDHYESFTLLYGNP